MIVVMKCQAKVILSKHLGKKQNKPVYRRKIAVNKTNKLTEKYISQPIFCCSNKNKSFKYNRLV